MDKLEKVELIREKTGVTYDDAKVALEANNDDVLDAIIWLERLGKAQTQTASYTTSAATEAGPVSPEMAQAQYAYQESTKRSKFGEWIGRVGAEAKRIVKASLDTSFVITRNGSRIFGMPVLFIILGILLWWAAFPLLVVGLFFDCHYHIEGAKPITVDVNKVMDMASDGVDSIKDTVMGDKDAGESDAQN